MKKLDPIVSDTIRLLEEKKSAGEAHVEVTLATLEELGRIPVRAVQQQRQTVGDSSSSQTINSLETEAKVCVKCVELARCRSNVVFGVGDNHAELMFIGEAPGADEDEQGKPFVGRAGQLLTKIIQAMGYRREEVYICNVLKCRPPQNRTPLPDEVTNCLPFLLKQIEFIKPKVIVALGATAVRSLIDLQLGITKMRGTWYSFRDIPIMPTFHPAYLLRNPPAKREVWQDMQMVMKRLGKPLPGE
jgi:uracil-DNA glycosylase